MTYIVMAYIARIYTIMAYIVTVQHGAPLGFPPVHAHHSHLNPAGCWWDVADVLRSSGNSGTPHAIACHRICHRICHRTLSHASYAIAYRACTHRIQHRTHRRPLMHRTHRRPLMHRTHRRPLMHCTLRRPHRRHRIRCMHCRRRMHRGTFQALTLSARRWLRRRSWRRHTATRRCGSIECPLERSIERAIVSVIDFCTSALRRRAGLHAC